MATPEASAGCAPVSGCAAPITEGMYQSDRCQFCGEFYEKVKPWICPECWDKIKAAIAKYPDELLKSAQHNE